MLIKYPKMIQPGSVSSLLTQNIDFAATFLELAGISVPIEVQGVSLLPLFEGNGKAEDWRSSLYYHYYEFPSIHMAKRHNGIRTERYKLIHFYNDIDEWELYDLQNDPYEMNNLIKHPDYQQTRLALEKELDSLMIMYREDPSDKW